MTPFATLRLDSSPTAAPAWLPRVWRALLAFGTVLLMGACSSPAVSARPPLTEADRQFMQEAAVLGLYDLRLAQIAEQRAIDPMLRTYAAMLAREHAQLGDDLRQLALMRDVLLPDAPPADLCSRLDALAVMAPAGFDGRFVQQVGLEQRREQIQRFEQAAGRIRDLELRGWAARALAAWKQQLLSAEQLPRPTRTMA